MKTNFISPEHVKHFQTEGYTCVSGIPEDVIELSEQIIDEWIDTKISEWCEEGLIKKDYKELARDTRFITAWADAGKPAYNRNSEHYLINEKMYNLLTHPYLIQLSSSLLETSELCASGVQNIRLKHPDLPWSVVPWHADLFYWKEYHTDMPLKFAVFWIPLQDVDADTGCLQVIPQSKISGRDFQMEEGKFFIPEERIENLEKRSIKMKRGDVLCMSEGVLHRSLPNKSPLTMWNIDLRFEDLERSGEISDKFGFVLSSESHPIISCEEWLKRRAPKKVIDYKNS